MQYFIKIQKEDKEEIMLYSCVGRLNIYEKSILKYFSRLHVILIKIQIECLEILLLNSKVNMAEHSKEFINKILEQRREVSSTEVKSMKVAL